MTTPPDAAFADALFGSDGMADPAPAPWRTETFADPLAAVGTDRSDAAIRVVPLPVVQLTPPDPRDFMSHLAEEAPPVAQQAPYASFPPPQALYPPQRAWPPPAPPRVGGSQRNAARQSSALTQRSAQRPAQRPGQQRPVQPARQPQRPAIQQRQLPVTQPGQRRPAATRTRKKSGGGWAGVFVVIVFLVASGAGKRILDAITELLNR